MKEWIVKSTRPFPLEEISVVKKAEAVSSYYGRSVCFFMQTGGQTYIPLVNYSTLRVGDTVELPKVKTLTLTRKRDDDIYRVME